MQPSNEGVDAMKVRYVSGSRIADHDTGAVNRCGNVAVAVRCGHHQFRLTFGFLVRVAESLSDVEVRLEREFPITGNICRADMLEPPGGCTFHDVQNVSRSADIHTEDLVAVLVFEGKRRGAMPQLVCGLG